MANVNTFAGIYNLTQVFTGTTETTLLVPASGYPGLPSPALASGAGLYIAPPPDVSNGELDGHPFRIRLSGVVKNGASNSLNVSVYLGTSSTTTSNTLMVSFTQVAATTASYPFVAEATCIWDSTSQKIWGTLNSIFNGVYTAVTTTNFTVVAATALSNIQFIPSFKFNTANATDTVIVDEFTLERI